MSAAQHPKSNVVHLFGGDDVALNGARMKALAGESMDARYLSNGSVNPDDALLDLCGDALHFAKIAANAHTARMELHKCNERWSNSLREQHDSLLATERENDREVTNRLRRAKKMKAQTPQGIFAKALLVRISKTGALELGMSLAADLVDCKALRDTIWPAGTGGAQ